MSDKYNVLTAVATDSTLAAARGVPRARGVLSQLSMAMLLTLAVSACQTESDKSTPASSTASTQTETANSPNPESASNPTDSAANATPALATSPVKPMILLVQTDYLEYVIPKAVEKVCQDKKNCPSIQIEYLTSNQDWVNTVINDQIRLLAYNNAALDDAEDESIINGTEPSNSETTATSPASNPTTKASGQKIAEKSLIATLDNFAKAQLRDMPADSELRYSLEVSPQYLGHIGLTDGNDLELFEVNSYVYLGGAHGMPYTEYLLLDTQAKRRLTLDDLLLAKAKPKFEALAHDAFRTWVKSLDSDVQQHEEMWPFFLTDNVSLNDQGVVLKYQAYDIAAYAFGQPELVIPFAKLNGVLKPEYMLP